MFLIKRLSTADCHQAEHEIIDLLKQLSDKPIMFSEVIEANHSYHIGAYRDGAVVGLIMATYMVGWYGNRLYLDGVVVDTNHRRQGCLQAMMMCVETLAVELNCKTIDFTSSRHNAKKAYAKLGFETLTTAFRKKIN